MENNIVAHRLNLDNVIQLKKSFFPRDLGQDFRCRPIVLGRTELFLGPLDRSAKACQWNRFNEIVDHSVFKSGNRMAREGGDGNDHPGKLNLTKEVEPIFMGKGKIEKNQIHLKLMQKLSRLGKRTGFAKDSYFGKARQEIAKILPTEWFVIDQDSSEGFHRTPNYVTISTLAETFRAEDCRKVSEDLFSKKRARCFRVMAIPPFGFGTRLGEMDPGWVTRTTSFW